MDTTAAAALSWSCASDVSFGYKKDHEGETRITDLQLLHLLDALDHLLRLRDSLSELLSRGWMEIAAARYAMGPSRVNQSLFSLKPCPASTTVTVSQDIATQSWPSFELSQHILGQEERGSHIPIVKKKDMTMDLRQRHVPGLSRSDTVEAKRAEMDQIVSQPHRSEPVGNEVSKQRHDASTWFGLLVSPHLRTAQSSFGTGLEILAELATVQSLVKAMHSQIMKAGGQHEEDLSQTWLHGQIDDNLETSSS